MFKDNKDVVLCILPPPNLTGKLHVGHLYNFLSFHFLKSMSYLVHVMSYGIKGREIIDVFGFDYSPLYSEILAKKEGIDVEDLNKDSKESIISSISKWGLNINTEKCFSTMDSGLIERVKTALEELKKKSMLFGGMGMVWWDPVAKSTLADIEVLHKEKDVDMYEISYKVKESNAIITVHTTRPETVDFDIMIAVHPSKFVHLHGKTCINPVSGKEMKIVPCVNVDPLFGTGAVKITPQHDAFDLKIAIDNGWKMSETNPDFKDIVKIKQRKKAIIDRYEFPKISSSIKSVPSSSRTGATVERVITDQVYIDMDAVRSSLFRSGEIGTLYFSKKMSECIKSLPNWCISRQNKTGINILGTSHKLDTWFYSAIYPSYVKQVSEHNGDCMTIVGHDICQFWIAKINAMSVVTKMVINNVIALGLVCDAKGRKMSKSKGNVIDIESYDINHLSLGLMLTQTSHQKINFSRECVEKGKRLADKVTNLVRLKNMPRIPTSPSDNLLIQLIGGYQTMKLNNLLNIARGQEFMTVFFKEFYNYVFSFCSLYAESTKGFLCDEFNSHVDSILKIMYTGAPNLANDLYKQAFQSNLKLTKIRMSGTHVEKSILEDVFHSIKVAVGDMSISTYKKTVSGNMASYIGVKYSNLMQKKEISVKTPIGYILIPVV